MESARKHALFLLKALPLPWVLPLGRGIFMKPRGNVGNNYTTYQIVLHDGSDRTLSLGFDITFQCDQANGRTSMVRPGCHL